MILSFYAIRDRIHARDKLSDDSVSFSKGSAFNGSPKCHKLFMHLFQFSIFFIFSISSCIHSRTPFFFSSSFPSWARIATPPSIK